MSAGLIITVMLVGVLAVFTGPGAAQDTEVPSTQVVAAAAAPVLKIDTGDTAWVLMSTAMVLLMTMPGLALFYGGLVRSKNILGTIMQSLVILCLVSLIWILVGYSLAFGPDKGGFIGGLEWAGLSGVGSEPHPVYGPTIPHQVFMLFQLMFAAITPALITGAFAERMKFSALLLFAALWSLLIYSPVAHWIWGGGWLGKMGALDFAGGAVVHISSGVSALVCAIVMGKRKGHGADYMLLITCPLRCWEPASSGSVGSGSTRAALWGRMGWPGAPFWRPMRQRSPAPWSGWGWNGPIAGSPLCSVWRAVRSPVWRP